MSSPVPPRAGPSASAPPRAQSAVSAALSPRTSGRPDRRPLLPPTVASAARASAAQGPSTAPRSASLAGGVGARAAPGMGSLPGGEAGRTGGKSLFASYMSLTGRARIAFGLVIGTIAIGGLMVDRNVLQDEEGQKGFEVRMVDRK
ncbi:hypothetical protein IAU60_005274 [Kwoniella sp. DSM 27419]